MICQSLKKGEFTMYRYGFTVVVFALVAAACVIAAPQGQDQATPERIRQLLDKLGSEKFAEREKAMKELEAIGPAALPTLRPALKSEDTEVRRRVETLVQKLEDQNLATDLLTAKRVRLQLKDSTVNEALAEIARQTGYQVNVDNTIGERKGTLDTGDTTFWQALDQLCTKAGLVESAVAAPVAGVPMARIKIVGGIVETAAPSALQLVNGKPNKMPTCYAGSVRIRVVRTTAAANGEIDIVVEVAGEPRLLDFAPSGQPVITKAVDDQGQLLSPLGMPDAPPAMPPMANNGIGNNGAGNGQGKGNGNGNVGNGVFIAGVSTPPTEGFKSFQVTLRLKAGEKQAKKLAELSGKLKVQTKVDTQPLLAIDDVLKAAGKTAKSSDGSSITVHKVEQLANGDVRVEVGMENFPGQNPLANLGGVIRIKGGAANIQINGQQIVVGGLANAFGADSPLRLLDAKGDSFAVAGMPSSSVNINGAQMSQRVTLVFRPRPGQGPATRLVVPSYRNFAFEMPFTLSNVTLP